MMLFQNAAHWRRMLLITAAGGVASVSEAAHANPVLIETFSGQTGHVYDVARSGPISSVGYTTDQTLHVRFTFDQPVAAVRIATTDVGQLTDVIAEPGETTVTVAFAGVPNRSHVTVRLIDVLLADGQKINAEAWFGVLTGDLDGSFALDINDLNILLGYFGGSDPYADLTGDGMVDLLDLQQFLADFGQVEPLPDLPPRLVLDRSFVFAQPQEWSPYINITLRDDRLAEDAVTVGAESNNLLLLPPGSFQFEGDGGQRRVRFRSVTGQQDETGVRVIASDGVTTTQRVFTASVGEDEPPIALIGADTYLGVAPLTIAFDATASYDEQQNIAGYAWTFGEAGGSSGAMPSFTFVTPGVHEVELRVIDTSGNIATAVRTVTVAAEPWNPAAPVSEAEARRFLWQAAWGPRHEDVQFIMGNGFEAWIDAQLTAPANYLSEALGDQAAQYNRPGRPENIWENYCVEGEDQLRQRLAWALVQIIAINPTDEHEELFNIYIRNALPDPANGSSGNYRELLSQITFNRRMGDWLTYRDNRKADPILGTEPDENYAREVMQLFTTGLWLLERNGTRARDIFGNLIPTYGEFEISQFARIFTGLRREEGSEVMRMEVPWHEFGEKQLLDYNGSIPADGYIPQAEESLENALADIEEALDNLFYHPSTAPFIAHQLIQRFVTSNPSPAYVERVAAAFEGAGPFGSGVRGDLFATIKAVLLDDEARNPAYRVNPYYGRTQEPVILLLGVRRALQSLDTREAPFPFRVSLSAAVGMQRDTGQGFLETPSVFNFFLPDFAPLGTELSQAGLSGPELQIVDENRALLLLRRLDDMGKEEQWAPELFDELLALAEDPAALVDRVDMIFNFGSTSEQTKQIMIDAVGDSNNMTSRVRMAVVLAVVNPELRVLR